MTIEASNLNSNSAPAEQASELESSVEFWSDTVAASDVAEDEGRSGQVSLLAMRGKPTPRPRDSWIKTAGKYPEGSPLDRIFEEGNRLREDERNET